MWVRLGKPPPHRYIEFLAQSKVICTSVGQVLPEYGLCIQVGTLVALSSSQSKHARFLTHQRFDASMRARFSTGHFFIEDGQNGGRLCNGVSLVSTPIHDASSALLWNTPSLSCLLETTSTLRHARYRFPTPIPSALCPLFLSSLSARSGQRICSWIVNITNYRLRVEHIRAVLCCSSSLQRRLAPTDIETCGASAVTARTATQVARCASDL